MRTLASPICYNEVNKIGAVLDRFPPNMVDKIAVVDDGSDDGSVDVIEQRGVTVLRHASRQGAGAAIRSAIRYGRKEGYDILIVLAGNDKDRPSEIERLIRPVCEDNCHIVQGSRYLPGGDYGNMPRYRRIATQWVHPLLFSLFSRKKMTDSTNGFRAIKLDLFDDKRINIDQDWMNQYELEPYILFKAIRLGYLVREVPVTKIYPDHELGYTKMRPITGWWSILRPIFLLGFGIKE